jgi:hypothetical protein
MIFAAAIMPCTKPSGEEELACQRNTSSRSAKAILVNPARQQSTSARIITIILLPLFLVVYFCFHPTFADQRFGKVAPAMYHDKKHDDAEKAPFPKGPLSKRSVFMLDRCDALAR